MNNIILNIIKLKKKDIILEMVDLKHWPNLQKKN